MDFKSELKKIASDVEKVLNETIPLPRYAGDPFDASRYAALDAGKRLRTFLTVQVGQLFDAQYDALVRAGACIEMSHNFSLIHDDLPCIDNDKLRRGRPSVWAKYGERNAVLAGDFLAVLPYQILANDARISANESIRLKLIGELASATNGMILGEWMDCEAESDKFKTAPEIDEVQELKTGRIFLACARFGSILGGASAEQARALDNFIAAMGLCFQITDDILDAVGDEAKVGKTLRKDDAAGKATYVSLLGVDGARNKAVELVAAAKSALDIFDNRADNLRALMDYMITRDS